MGMSFFAMLSHRSARWACLLTPERSNGGQAFSQRDLGPSGKTTQYIALLSGH